MRSAFSFLTVVGRGTSPTPSTFVWFPLVGALIGLAVGGVWWVGDRLWPPLVAATLAVSADLWITGLLHFDGLADAGDGLLASLTRERRLAVMRDPAVGAFGLVAVTMVLVMRVAALAATRPSVVAIAGLWCASRTAMVAVTLSVPYARDDGIVGSFIATTPRSRRLHHAHVVTVIVGLVAAAALLLTSRSALGLVALAVELATVAGVVALSTKRVGGYTGDVLGASGVLGETLGLIVLAVR